MHFKLVRLTFQNFFILEYFEQRINANKEVNATNSSEQRWNEKHETELEKVNERDDDTDAHYDDIKEKLVVVSLQVKFELKSNRNL